MLSMYDQRFRDILLLILGFFGALWFFLDMGNHDPLSAVEIPLSNEEAILAVDSIITSWEYQSVNLRKRAEVNSYSNLIDHLQREYGRKDYIKRSKANSELSLPMYNWEVNEFLISEGKPKSVFSMQLSSQGEVITFEASDEVITEQTPFNRGLLSFALRRSGRLSQAQQDSMITSLVNFQHLRGDATNFFRMGLGSNDNYETGFIWSGVDYYLQNSFWKKFSFTRDSLNLDENGALRFAKAYLTSKDTVMGVVPKLEIEILPAGVIRKLEVDLGEYNIEEHSLSEIKSNSIVGLALLFIVWLLISFYLRLKSRSIDTRPALIIAIVSGFLVSVLFVLVYAKDFGVTLQTRELSSLYNEILGFGVAGAITATVFFIVTAVSDSVTRQYWPEKLITWDLVRRGMFKNKPIGWAILRAISIGSMLAGIYALFLNVFPETYLSGNAGFLSSRFVFAPFANVVVMLLLVVAYVGISLLILGNQVYATTSKKWIIPILSGVLFALLDPLFITITPISSELILNFGLGILIGVFYVAFDFVTITFGFFIFANYISSANGWLVSNSPDGSVFFGFIITLILSACSAFYFLLKGDDKDSLPDYVPEYIEDLAKEERVKQELDIARTVQKTFLPSITPEIEGFDSAAVCFPAQETGGDYYDIISLDEDRTAIAIGDVSGKGIQAAFYMTFAKGVIHSLCTIFPSPKAMLFRVNKLFNQHATRGTFISMIYGVLNSKEKTFTYIRAGHNPMLYKKANGEISWLQPRGVAIGMSKGEGFNKVMEEETIAVEKGDVLVLYTDGITEAQNEAGDFYDEPRLLRLVKREKTTSAKELRDLIIEDVRIFIGNALQYDDMTLVVIKA